MINKTITFPIDMYRIDISHKYNLILIMIMIQAGAELSQFDNMISAKPQQRIITN